jgi:hypothetical protein
MFLEEYFCCFGLSNRRENRVAAGTLVLNIKDKNHFVILSVITLT